MAAYSDQDRERALAIYREHSLAEASRLTGVPKPTLRRWARNADLDPAALADSAVERTRAATAARTTDMLERAAVARDGLIPKLAVGAHAALDLEMRVLGDLAAGRPNPLPEGVRLRDVVGSRTRLIHDLQLLTGQATDRSAGEPIVVFAAPRPDRRNPPEVLDLGRADDPTVIDHQSS